LSDEPLSDNEADDLLKAARDALGDRPGASVAANTALATARRALTLLSLGLINSGINSERRES
jgi:hypothetical protein